MPLGTTVRLVLDSTHTPLPLKPDLFINPDCWSVVTNSHTDRWEASVLRRVLLVDKALYFYIKVIIGDLS